MERSGGSEGSHARLAQPLLPRLRHLRVANGLAVRHGVSLLERADERLRRLGLAFHLLRHLTHLNLHRLLWASAIFPASFRSLIDSV